MCGIFGYVGEGEENAVDIALAGIKRLEYRGYDSAGVAAIVDGRLVCEKRVGSVALLESALPAREWRSRVAISHTRWATHGRPTLLNAHPHLDAKGRVAVVHNGIIDNEQAIRRRLEREGILFKTETDSEVIAELIAFFYEGDLLKAVQRSVENLEGAYAIAVLHEEHPGLLLCAARESPLCIGIGEKRMYVASDPNAFLPFTRRVIALSASEVAALTAESFEVFDAASFRIEKKSTDFKIAISEPTKGEFAHFTLKEIFEQPKSIEAALEGRLSPPLGTALLDEIGAEESALQSVERMIITACGSSYHAGLIGALMLEERARLATQVEIASEFRYRNPIIDKNAIALAISQSGETADLLASMRELKAKGARVMGLCNAPGSTLAREVSATLFLRAGPEIGVASTKAFTSQLTLLSLLALKIGRLRNLSLSEGREIVDALLKLPDQVRAVLAQADAIERLAEKYSHYHNFFYLGRRYMYPAALEGSLKLKEMAYVPAQAYPAGEIKHGPIALVDERCLTVAFASDKATLPKMIGSLREIKARSGVVLTFAEEGAKEIERVSDEILYLPATLDELAPVAASVAAQLFAYYVALKRGSEIDKPRNLAKSVTVE